tara:strand:+ start:664 stop:1221 length:558 start_codon:yes stop_codon:yes gene_type:complete
MAFNPKQSTFPEINKDTLEIIQNYGAALTDLDSDIKDLEEKLSAAKDRFKDIAERKLPELMTDMGIEELKLSDGAVISKKEFVYARIKDPEVCFKWLAEHGEDAIIDNTFTLKFKRGQEAAVKDVEEILSVFNVDYKKDEGVHWKRLETWTKEALADPKLSQSLPREAFGVHEGEIVKFKAPPVV